MVKNPLTPTLQVLRNIPLRNIKTGLIKSVNFKTVKLQIGVIQTSQSNFVAEKFVF